MRVIRVIRSRQNRPALLAVVLGSAMAIDGYWHWNNYRDRSKQLADKDRAYRSIVSAAKAGDQSAAVKAAEAFVRLPAAREDEHFVEVDQILKDAQISEYYMQAAAACRAGDAPNIIESADRFLTMAANNKRISALNTLGGQQRFDPRIEQIQTLLRLAVADHAIDMGLSGRATDISALLAKLDRLTNTAPVPVSMPKQVATTQNSENVESPATQPSSERQR